MPKDKRRYITVAVDMPEHPKTEALSDKAFRHLLDLWCWSKRNDQDGHVPAAVWLKRTTAKTRAELLTAPFAIAKPDQSVDLRDFLEHQQSAEEAERTRVAKVAAGSKGGAAKAAAARAAAVAAAKAKPLATATAPVKQKPKQTPSTDVAALAVEVLPSEAPSPTGQVSAKPTDGQRAQRLTKSYTDRVPLSSFHAVRGVVAKAIGVGHSDAVIAAALSRLVDSGRPVTSDVLRIEIEGRKPRQTSFGVGYTDADREGPSRAMTGDEWASEPRSSA